VVTRDKKSGIEVLFPAIECYTDNGAMIAAGGAFHHITTGESHPLSLAPQRSLSL